MYTVSGYSAGSVKIAIGTNNYGGIKSSDGTYIEYIRCKTDGTMYFYADADFIGDIDNVSVTFIPEYNHPDTLLCSFELPTVARHGVASDCTSISVKLLSSTVGVMGFHQAELLPNLLDNPSFDFGAAADPWIPAGWTNSGLDAGDSEEEATILNSGGKSLQLNTGASVESIYASLLGSANKFYSTGLKSNSGGGTITICSINDNYIIQSSSTLTDFTTSATGGYASRYGIFKCKNSDNYRIRANAGATAIRYVDDAYMFLLDDVTLTATPASLANSLESGGIRVVS